MSELSAQATAPPPRDRKVRVAVFVALVIAALATLWQIRGFSQQRFFTVDEYQYGHATWLVSQGLLPYRDFYEHHFPLSYVLHAPVLATDGTFSERALQLRTIAFVWLGALSVVVTACTWLVTRDGFAAVLASFLPLAFGFSLMSAIDYRADNFAACSWIACLALLETSRVRGWRLPAIVAGVLFASAILMTQKAIWLAGGTLAVFAYADLRRFLRQRRWPEGAFLRFPLAFAGPALAVLATAVGVALWLDLLPAAWEATIVHSLQHERFYTPRPVGEFLEPFLAATAWTTIPILLFALVAFEIGAAGFWLAAVIVALVATALMKAQYPYNYVCLCYLVVLGAVRGYAGLLKKLQLRWGGWQTLRPLLYLLPLAVLPDQLGFVAHASANERQLATLDKIQAWTRDGDAVIDSAGGAMFRPHASYHWYHGEAHRLMFYAYFATRLVDDYRRSQAPLMLRDGRMSGLPPAVRVFLDEHYIPADGSLQVLGFRTPAAGAGDQRIEIDVIRTGDYHVFPATGGDSPGDPPLERAMLRIDGAEVTADRVRLEAGRHEVVVRAGAPAHLISWLPPAFFREPVGCDDFSKLFEYVTR